MLITILNIIGLSVNFIGVCMMFKANPKVRTSIGQLPNTEDIIEMQKDPDNTKLFRRGMIVLSIGFIIQLISLVISLFQIPVNTVVSH